jgi:hypothetical protein
MQVYLNARELVELEDGRMLAIGKLEPDEVTVCKIFPEAKYFITDGVLVLYVSSIPSVFACPADSFLQANVEAVANYIFNIKKRLGEMHRITYDMILDNYSPFYNQHLSPDDIPYRYRDLHCLLRESSKLNYMVLKSAMGHCTDTKVLINYLYYKIIGRATNNHFMLWRCKDPGVVQLQITTSHPDTSPHSIGFLAPIDTDRLFDTAY